MHVRHLLLLLVAGCGFQVGLGGQQPPGDARGDGGSADVDAESVIDAPIDGPIQIADAPCMDEDNDGVCNEMDTWPCGPLPQSPGSPVTFEEFNSGNRTAIVLSDTSLMGGTRLLTVAPGATFTVTASYSIVDCICPGCIDQIQIGLVPGMRKECLYDANPPNPCQNPTTGTETRTLTAPTTPGVYDVRFRLGQDFDCDGNSNSNFGWWTNQAPPTTQTVARVCVH